jgi:hypothetical protein
MRLAWHNSATLSLTIKPSWKLASRYSWLDSPIVSAHFVTLSIGPLRIVRIRPSRNHLIRLGLPVI